MQAIRQSLQGVRADASVSALAARIQAAIPFGIGIIFIASYYLFILPRDKRKEKLVTISVEVSETTLKLARGK